MADQNAHLSQRIIVGVDGSPGSKAALRWAMGLAGQTGAVVEAVTAWQDPSMYGTGIGYAWMPSSFDGGTVSKTARDALDATIAEVSAQLHQPVNVVARVVQGHPAERLIAVAEGAQMLVVGTRGHGTVRGMLLGSISQHCVHHAPCPVVVVPLESAASTAQAASGS